MIQPGEIETREPGKMRQAYIAGPMRGVKEFNFPLFDEVRDYIKALGWTAVSPADHDRDLGFDWTGAQGTSEEIAAAGADRTEFIRWDLAIILSPFTTDIVMLPYWWKSQGARLERDVAKQIGLRIWRWDAEKKEIVLCR